MLALTAILILLLATVIMLTVRWLRPGFTYYWLIAATGIPIAFALILAAGFRLPQTIAPGLPVFRLLIDRVSWPYAAGIGAVAFAAILTAATQPARREWHILAGIFAIASFAITAVLAGSPVTMLLAWASLDLIELWVFLVHVPQSQQRLRVTAGFAARAVGVFIALWGITSAPQGWALSLFDPLAAGPRLFLYLAAGLRLGVLPLNLPFTGDLPLPASLGAVLRLAPAAANLALLARIGSAEANEYRVYILAITLLAALYGAWSWATLREEGGGIPYWILGTAGLAVCASLVGEPRASTAWGVLCVFAGGTLALISSRRLLYPLAALVLLQTSALPFTPGWSAALIHHPAFAGQPGFVGLQPAAVAFSAGVLIVHALLLAGCIRHILKIPPTDDGIERWAGTMYIAGMISLPLAHFAAGFTLWPTVSDTSLVAWFGGLAALLLAAAVWFTSLRRPRLPDPAVNALRRVFSLDWLYGSLWAAYRALGRVIVTISGILEGEGGVLWAFVLLALLFTLITRRIPGD